MSISNLYPLGTNTEALTSTDFIQTQSFGPGITGDGTISTITASFDIGKTFNTTLLRFPRLTATMTGTNSISIVLKNDPRFNPSITLANDTIIGTTYIKNVSTGAVSTLGAFREAGGGGVPATSLQFDSGTFAITNTQQYDISILITYPRE